MKTLLIFKDSSVSNHSANRGFPLIGMRHLGQISVKCPSLLPIPAASNKALNFCKT